MNAINFENLPLAVAELTQKVDELLARTAEPTFDPDRHFTVDELRDYLPEKPARATIFGWTCQNRIPHKKYGRRLYFLKSDVDAWLRNGRRMS